MGRVTAKIIVMVGGVEYINLFFLFTFGAPHVLYLTPEHMRVGFEFSSKEKESYLEESYLERKRGGWSTTSATVEEERRRCLNRQVDAQTQPHSLRIL